MFFCSTSGTCDPKTVCDPKRKTQLSAKTEANITLQGRAPTPAGRPEKFSTKEDCVLAFPTLHTPSCRGPAPLQPVFQASRAHLPGSVPSLGLSSLLGGHPLPLGPGLFGNNGGKVKHGWKTGSESLNSQAGSLEGAEQQEGPGQMGGRFPGCSLPAPQTGSPQIACL